MPAVKPASQMAAGPSDGAQCSLAVIAADRVIYDMSALRAARCLETLGKRTRGILVNVALYVAAQPIGACVPRASANFSQARGSSR